ncbi:biotin/lipoyl-binding protein [Flammeovirga yaeyamensis]|uniref:Biotin/lipoyl-binding protein n=1 Tax=Flammeovirga yaeyamensis TaxID=367791 RepID=A0AAX1MYM6_9BACT|nr:biotin/lipoyl-binding protein [Flammeovirga yaeyamensis]MBB3696081.1 HlyD family secretion protein [Flammeovirga yaeyamensis]NMF34766.1 biotin/lipoyl-binding protein [Flammeovirga yaeyamensis]QWG00406.1 biotin/lipoyl-binding protein [Flammeovirga yaeyamensis]
MKNIYTVVLGALLITACSEQPQQTQQYKGKVKKEVVYVASKVPGRVVKMNVEEGQKVSEGDTLAVIDLPEAEAKLDQALGAVKAAKAQYEMAFNGATKEQLEQVDAAYDAAKEQYQFAEKSFKRIEEMYQDSLISSQKYDEVRTKYLMAKAKYEGTEAKKREVVSGVRNEKQRMALGQLERAKGALREVNIALSERYILAPKAMRVESISLQEGELALPGYSIFTAYADNSTFFRFAMSEEEVLKYKLNESVTMTSAFDKSIVVKGKVISIKEEMSYATRKSMNPNYEIDQSLYVLKIRPTDMKKAEKLLTNTTFVMPKK